MMMTYECSAKRGITRSKEFEKKGLAEFAINTGLKCGNGCLYCSTPSLVRTHPYFKSIGHTAFEQGYAIVDPDLPERVKIDARRMQKRGLIQLCTISDAWSPEAQRLQLGRKCLKAVLEEPGWTIRTLTKNAAVVDDFDLIEKHGDRVKVGLSVTATPADSHILRVVEVNASSIEDRIAVLGEAHQRGLRTYAMFCPILPHIGESCEKVNELVQLAENWGAEEIFVEPVNPRGSGLRRTQEALEINRFYYEAACVSRIRCRDNWSSYVVKLLQNVQSGVRRYSSMAKLRFLLYPKGLDVQDLNRIQADDAGVVWL